jgi:diacylglycerol kinase (ATP)
MRDDSTKRPVRVVYNPASGDGSGHAQALRIGLGLREPDLVVTREPGDAREAARGWREGLLVVVGGDGTVNEVVDGLGKAGFPEGVTLGLLPVGTGNDLGATLGIPADPEEAGRIIRAGRERTLDVARLRSGDAGERFFANVAIGAFGARASEEAADEALKERWGKLSYLRASLKAASSFDAVDTRLTVDGAEYALRAANLVVGNRRFAGGGWPAAPEADPEDGLLEVVVVEDVGLAGLLSLGPKAFVGADYLQNEGIFFIRGRSVRVEGEKIGGLEFNADGELVGRGPAEFAAAPRALRFIVGPGYVPEPARGARER